MIWESNKRSGPYDHILNDKIKSTPIFISKEALEDIRKWIPDELSEDDRRKIYEHYEEPDFDLGI